MKNFVAGLVLILSVLYATNPTVDSFRGFYFKTIEQHYGKIVGTISNAALWITQQSKLNSHRIIPSGTNTSR
jgi:hypothetical protein